MSLHGCNLDRHIEATSTTAIRPHRLISLNLKHLVIIAQPALAFFDELKFTKPQANDKSRYLLVVVDVDPIAPSR